MVMPDADVTFTKTSHMNRNDENNKVSLDEQIRIENEIIKMKLMLEHGAQFSTDEGDERMDPALEHAFLKHVLAMEEAYKKGESISIFEKIGSPTDIVALEDLTREDLPMALQTMKERLSAHGIEVRPVEDDIDPKEFYRFLTRELMNVKIFDKPGIHCFFWDTFPRTEGCRLERMARKECFQTIIAGKAPLGDISKENPLRLNGFEHHDRTSVQHRLMKFRGRYEDVLGLNTQIDRTILERDSCTVYGSHETSLCMKDRCEIVKGEWFVSFQRNETGGWDITEIDIDGLSI
jgi:hypothetical protein